MSVEVGKVHFHAFRRPYDLDVFPKFEFFPHAVCAAVAVATNEGMKLRIGERALNKPENVLIGK